MMAFGKANMSAPAGAPFVVRPAFHGDLDVRVSAAGTVEPVRIVEVSTELSGTIKDILVDYNDTVKAGQVLATLDDDVPTRQLARARATHALAEARLREAQINRLLAASEKDRKQRLAERQVASERDLETAVGAFRKAAALVEVQEAEARIAAAEVALATSNLEKTRIVAPIDGVVLRRNVERGQVIAASFQSPVLFRVAADIRKMQVKVDVDEADALAVKPGQHAMFKGESMRDRNVPVVVEKIYLGPEVVQGVVTYKAILGFNNDELQLKPGMTTSTDITIAERRNVLLVPNAALRFAPSPHAISEDRMPGPMAGAATLGVGQSDQPDGRRLYKLVGGVPTPVRVQIGASDSSYSEIIGGDVAVGDSIVIDQAPVQP
ncbi:efflux RND transporter periplasmic adaptor subunit [Bradyrhizobium sp. LHD-71]|uniref:efflux RND transporter periplasmic adaptor subunit n=1 Tax=Bradyrhizobium sp. LHD-71 TaxID=3072141 RepID=UPI00280EDDBA|nr:efflux RND transporter periplasmic adaptor subunit [Bradyrhizobium sp. LHD-71]MDQ8728102.1 efflux RND transporter periplasmic adaptor subunit [Bradyrhizobium sp. LHD-71]